jgi:DNA-binding CsgD family transcriptional regulator
MRFELIDAETGNALGAFEDEGSVKDALSQLGEGELAGLVLLELDEDGDVTGSWPALAQEATLESPASVKKRSGWRIPKIRYSPTTEQVGLAVATLERELESETEGATSYELHSYRTLKQQLAGTHLASLQKHLGEHGWQIEESPPRSERLTRRENQVLSLLAEGETSAQIADHLGLSPSTVRTLVQGILTKLRARSRIEAAVYYYRDRDR